MALGSGQAGQVGFKLETTPGVPVTVDTFVPFLSESLDNDTPTMVSKAIVAGRRIPAQHAQGNTTLAGGLQMELYNKGQEDLLALLIGTPNKTGAGPYTRTYNATDLTGVSATMQVGRPEVGGTVDPFTWAGVKAQSGEIAFKAGEFVTLGVDPVGMTESTYRTVTDGVTTNTSTTITSATAAFVAADIGKPIAGTGIPANATIAAVASATSATLSAAATATGTGVTFTFGKALASASFLSGQTPYTFAHGAATIAASGVNVTGGKVKFGSMLNAGRRFIGTRNIAQPLESDVRDITFELDLEWGTMAHYTRFLSHAEHAVVVAFTAGTDSLTITGNCYLGNSPKPQVSSRDILEQKLVLPVAHATSDTSAFSAVMVNGTA